MCSGETSSKFQPGDQPSWQDVCTFSQSTQILQPYLQMGHDWYSACSVLQNPHIAISAAQHVMVSWLVPCLLVFWLKFCLHFSSVRITWLGETGSLNNLPPNQEAQLWPHHSSVWNHFCTVKFKIIWNWKSLCQKKVWCNEPIFMQDLRFSQQCWRFKSSGTWCCINWCAGGWRRPSVCTSNCRHMAQWGYSAAEVLTAVLKI